MWIIRIGSLIRWKVNPSIIQLHSRWVNSLPTNLFPCFLLWIIVPFRSVSPDSLSVSLASRFEFVYFATWARKNSFESHGAMYTYEYTYFYRWLLAIAIQEVKRCIVSHLIQLGETLMMMMKKKTVVWIERLRAPRLWDLLMAKPFRLRWWSWET